MKPIIFYDGECALCHGFVLFVLRHDHEGRFCFSPLQGETLAERISENDQKRLPDSIVVLFPQGKPLIRSQAVISVLQELRGWPKVAGKFLAFFPRPVRDAGYNVVAAVRKRIFGVKTTFCPIVPENLRDRFLP